MGLEFGFLKSLVGRFPTSFVVSDVGSGDLGFVPSGPTSFGLTFA